jgi:hypothetical protein
MGGGIRPCNDSWTASSGKEWLMTERDRRTGSGGTADNVRDELDEAAKRGKPERDASGEAVDRDEVTPGTGGVKDNVSDEWDESQRR